MKPGDRVACCRLAFGKTGKAWQWGEYVVVEVSPELVRVRATWGPHPPVVGFHPDNVKEL